jgi:hypothetical protein
MSKTWLAILQIIVQPWPKPLARSSVPRPRTGSLIELAECERESLDARVEKPDLELSISDGLWLSDQLINPWLANRAAALVVNVNSVSRAHPVVGVCYSKRLLLPIPWRES